MTFGILDVSSHMHLSTLFVISSRWRYW